MAGSTRAARGAKANPDRSTSSIGTMSDADSLLWRLEADPVLRPTVVAVAVLDRAPRWSELRARLEALTELVPRLRSQVAPLPLGLWRPRWVDVGFDLDQHLHRVPAPGSRSLRSVLDMAQEMAERDFDPLLPPWESVLIEDLSDPGAALIVKLQHALTDGLGGLGVLSHLVDRQRRARPRQTATAAPSRSPARPPARALADRHRCSLPGPADLVRLPGVLVRSARQAPGQLAQVVSMVGSVAQLLAPAGQPLSPLMLGRGATRRFEVIDLPLGGLRGAATVTRGTLNDVLMAGTVLGLGRYHLQHGVRVDRLRVLMPVSTRRGGDLAAANRFVPVRFVVPVLTEPAECVHRIRQLAAGEKHAPALKLSDALAVGLDLLPPSLARAVWGSLLKGDDLCITDMPGPPFETYLAGARVDRLYAFAPPSGAAFNISLLTPAGRDCVGISIDRQAVPDGSSLASCIAAGLHDVIALGTRP